MKPDRSTPSHRRQVRSLSAKIAYRTRWIARLEAEREALRVRLDALREGCSHAPDEPCSHACDEGLQNAPRAVQR
jgi:hypothetical protein